MTCDLCESAATVHLTEIRCGVKHERHLCDRHAEQVIGTRFPTAETRNRVRADYFRRVIAFIKEHNRVPTTEESLRLKLPMVSPSSQESIADTLRWMQRILDSIEANEPLHGEIEFKDE